MKHLLTPIALVAGLLPSVEANAQDFRRELDFCRTIITEMPDANAPSFYRALPTSSGTPATGAGWSSHVNSWFVYMRNPSSGGIKQYVTHRGAISPAAESYERVVLERGKAVATENSKAGFRQGMKEFNTANGSKVVNLVNKYVVASRETEAEYAKLRQALAGAREARASLQAVESDYAAFITGLQHGEVSAGRDKLVADAKAVQDMVSMVLRNTGTAVSYVPFTGLTVLKAIGGEPVTGLVGLALGPDSRKLAEIDARLAKLDAEVKEHKDKGFRSRIDAARAKLERSEIDPAISAKAILTRKLESFQAVQELAGLEREGQGPQYFHKLRDYYKDVASAAGRLDEVVHGYYRFLTRDRPAESELLLRHIEVDINHVKKTPLPDPNGQWMRLAEESSSWLRRDFVPWHKAEVERAAACLTGFKELRHLQLVDDSMNLISEALGGIPVKDLGRYRL